MKSDFDEYKENFEKENNVSKLIEKKNKEIEIFKNDINESEKELIDIKSHIKEKDNLIERLLTEKEKNIKKNEELDNIYSINKEKYENIIAELK